MQTDMTDYNVVTARKRSWGKVMFLQVCVISVHRGGVCLSACWDTPPGADTPQEQIIPKSRHPLKSRPPLKGRHTPKSRHHSPRADTPRADIPPRADTPHLSRHPPRADTPLKSRHPPPPQCRECWDIRSMRGRYASYWNAILLFLKPRDAVIWWTITYLPQKTF